MNRRSFRGLKACKKAVRKQVAHEYRPSGMGYGRKRYFRDEFDVSQRKDESEFAVNGDSFLFKSGEVEQIEPADPVNPTDLADQAGSEKLKEPMDEVVDVRRNSFSNEKERTYEDLQDGLQKAFQRAPGYPDYVTQIRQIIPGMSLEVAMKLVEKYQGEEDLLSKAVSSYFEEPIEAERTAKRSVRTVSSPQLSQKKTRREVVDLTSAQYHSNKCKQNFLWKKFIGSLQVNAMATRPTLKPLKYGTKLEIIQSSGELPISKLYNSNGRKKVSMASFVKIYDSAQKREIGRIPEDIAQVLYPLMHTNEVDFEVTMVFCDNKRLSIGDGFILQLDCFLTSVIFDNPSREPTPSQSVRWGGGTKLVETEEELRSRSRRVGLISLFDKLRLKTAVSDVDGADCEQEDTEVIRLDDEDDDTSTLQDIATQQGNNSMTSSQHEDVMDLNQLKVFYKATLSSDSLKSIPETEPPASAMKIILRPYQKQGLTWMLRREREFEKASESQGAQDVGSSMMNPLWKRFKWPRDMSWGAQRIAGYSEVDKGNFFYANLHTGEFCLDKPILKTTMRGGILSDEMGLGKTISALSLILTSTYDSSAVDRSPAVIEKSETTRLPSFQTFKKPYAAKTTLIVVPTSLLTQWQSEFDKANKSPDLYCEVYYGGNVNNLKTLLTKAKNPPSVVLTTYGIVQNEWSKMVRMDRRSAEESTGLFSITFYRLIIDEGHIIRNRTTSTSKAIMEIFSKCRWVLTGTPIINRLDDLYSIVKFLRLEPWSQLCYWKMFVSDPFERKDYRQAFDVVNAILEPVFLRRTKQMQDINGRPLVTLPPKEVVVEKLSFSNAQGAIYKHYLEKAENSVRKGLARGDLLKKYSTILVHILRLRQICCDVELLRRHARDENDEDLTKESQVFNHSDDANKIFQEIGLDKEVEEIDETLLCTVKSRIEGKYSSSSSLKNLECSICTTEPIEVHKILFTECCHSFCQDCLMEYIEFQKQKNLDLKCPNCRETITSIHLFSLKLKDNQIPLVVPFRNVTRSSKIEALLKHCKMLQETSPGEQIVVFSQFSSFLDILETELGETFSADPIIVYKFDGRLSLKERANVLKEFCRKDFDNQKVLLMSLKTGGVGLNLTCASYAFMMDPWWSPSMEDQAIDRIHRIGQINQVKVTRFIIENSIEEKMLKIQERKRTIGEAMDADEDERRKRRIDEIQMLFE